MRHNYPEKPVTINVALPPAVHANMRAYMKTMGLKTNRSFIENAVDSPPVVLVKMLEIDGKPASSGSALLQVGEVLYRFTGGVFQSFPEYLAERLLSERRYDP